MDSFGGDTSLDAGVLSIDDLLHLMVERGASDLHIKQGSAPMIRVDGELTPATYEILTADAVRAKVEEELLLTLIWKMEEELLATHPNMATRT